MYLDFTYDWVFYIYVYLVLDSIWMVYGFIVNMIYAVYMQYYKSIISRNE